MTNHCLVACSGLIALTLSFSAVAQNTAARRSTTYPGGHWEPGPAKYGHKLEENVPVTMDDGAVLKATVAYPLDASTKERASGKFPVIIEHTPYGFGGRPVPPNTYLTDHGYIYMVLRARGTGASGGEVDFFGERDAKDGKAAVDWAAHTLDGGDGRVALMGCSYPGGLALDTAAYLGPNSPVKAVIASCVGLSQVNRESLLHAGLMTSGFWSYTSFTHRMWGPNEAADRFVKKFSDEVQAGGDVAYDRDFWKDRNSIALAQKLYDSNLPILLWSGWRDIVEFGAVRAYSALQNAFAKRPIMGPMSANQPTTPRYQIVIGNWDHAQGLDSGVFLQWLDIDASVVRRWLASKRKIDESGAQLYADSSIATMRNVLSAIFSAAKVWKYCDSNPAAEIEIESLEPVRRKRILTQEEVGMFLANIQDSAMCTAETARLIVRVALTCGVRISEILGLQWQDVCPSGVLSVRSRYRRGDVAKPKTRASRREVWAGTVVLDLLARRSPTDQVGVGFSTAPVTHWMIETFNSMCFAPQRSRRESTRPGSACTGSAQ